LSYGRFILRLKHQFKLKDTTLRLPPDV